MRIKGYAAVFGSWSVDLGGFRETIRPGAFRRTLADGHNIIGVHHHDLADLLASTRAGTLRLNEDQRGLAFEMDLPDTSLGRDVHTLVRRGDLATMSFRFMVNGTQGEHWKEGDRFLERELRDVHLVEVSTTATPAYGDTTVNARAQVHTGDAKRNNRVRNAMVRRFMRARLEAVK